MHWCDDMKVLKAVEKYCAANTFVLVENNNCIVVDCGIDGESLYKQIVAMGLNLLAIFVTHGHFDHIRGVAELKRLSGAPVYCGKGESDIINSSKNLAKIVGTICEHFAVDKELSDEEEVKVCGFDIKRIATPGHTIGGSCYLIEDMLFSGDTLFQGSYGRTDFPSGDELDILNSLCNTIFELPPQTRVYAGHSCGIPTETLTETSYDTTIEYEKTNNAILELL